MGRYRADRIGHGFPVPGPQSPSSGTVMDEIFFLDEPAWQAARTAGDYDLVVIGSGFCGYAVAQRALARDPRTRILMLERGGYFLPEHFQNLPGPFADTLSSQTETFPWTLSRVTAEGRAGGYLRWQHGMVPFFGGRSILWSAWCPRPSAAEMTGWPQAVIDAATRGFGAAEALLRVQSADRIDPELPGEETGRLGRPVYGALQRRLQTLLQAAPAEVPGVYRAEPAPLASNAKVSDRIDFQKFSTPGEILTLVEAQARLKAAGLGASLDIAASCIVETIVAQDGVATALTTSRGPVTLGGAKLVLALGALPAATLVRTAFDTPEIGRRYCAHFTSTITARVPKAAFEGAEPIDGLQLGAAYVAGTAGGYDRQYHMQISALSDPAPLLNSGTALRYMPDVLTTASRRQLESARGYVVLPCATLGEMEAGGAATWFRANPADPDPTTNALLQLVESPADRETWDAMDAATFATLETVLSPGGPADVEYWHGDADTGVWRPERPPPALYRNDATVHDGSTLYLGEAADAPVDLDYRLRGSANVYVTGAALWPRAGSWNPTLTMVALAIDLADRLVPAAPR
ncbi:GMC oxidoreductase [Prosthecomicrobium pneumaticum]|uniref:Glucose-methanol-choline oxidoreductase C-terminal domain-containing protein n=1 Tax=Prosthecomicrobium pneumaticum TaxID=81895 RepID=A0A7W9FM03_9HYPH|nr:GMC oxidoreductase [Prosthecomicrobium pneumaticum]MBB5753135.1 hypothetical protein [Prosthecomicrobium pneumaticum]